MDTQQECSLEKGGETAKGAPTRSAKSSQLISLAGAPRASGKGLLAVVGEKLVRLRNAKDRC